MARTLLANIGCSGRCIIPGPGVIGSDVPWLECPAYNALTWVITVTE